MASPAVQTAAGNSGNSATPTITEPASAAQGDLLIAVVGNADEATAITGLTGWTQLGEGDDGQGNRYWYGWIIRGASAPDLVAASANANWVTGCIRVTGHDGTTPIGTDHATATGSSTNPDPPNVDPGSSRDHLAVAVSVQEGKSTTYTPPTTPGTYTEQTDVGTSGAGPGSQHVSHSIATREYTGQAENPGTFTSSTNDGWIAITMIVRPDPSAGQTVSGVLFSKAPSFIAGAVTTAYTISGVLFSQPPAFVSGSVNFTLGGVLFSKPPSFISGTVTTAYTIDGALFSKPPSFPTGAVQADQQIDGVLFSKPPSFIAGAVIPDQTVSGVLFSKPPLFIIGSVLPTAQIHVNGDGTGANVVNELNTTTNLYASIDDDPGSPTDSDWNNNRTLTPSQFYLLENMPANFDQAQSATITVRNRGQEWGTGDLKLYVRLYQSDETTPLSDEVLVITRNANSGWVNTQVTLTGIVAGSKAIWDGARLRLRWDTV